MDFTARNLLKAHMESGERKMSVSKTNPLMADVNFFDKDKRYPWEDIKAWVIKTM